MRGSRGGPPPSPPGELSARVVALDRRPYPEYRRLLGRHALGEFTLIVDRVHGDPFAGPARVRIAVDRDKAGLPADLAGTRLRRMAVEDALARTLATALDGLFGRAATPPGAGRLHVEPPGSAVLERSCCHVGAHAIELRLLVDLPASGGHILGFQAEQLLRETIQRLATSTLLYSARRLASAREHVVAVEDHAALQSSLRERGWVCFVADGSTMSLARGGDITVRAQGQLRAVIELQGGGGVAGMALPRGVTVLVGGSTGAASALLAGIAAGRLPHPPGDGRVRVATDAQAVEVRSEPGRSVRRLDLSGWVTTEAFGSAGDLTSDQASPFLSQAAAAVEAIEAGARVLLVDEDRSTTSFLTRDGTMQRLLPARRGGTIPLLARARSLYERLGVSTIVATSSVGDLVHAAHTVVRVEEHGDVEDVTAVARELARAGGRWEPETLAELQPPGRREPLPPARAEGAGLRTGMAGAGAVRLGDETVDLSALAHGLERGQMLALAAIAGQACTRMQPGRSVPELLDVLEAHLAEHGLDALDPPVAYELSAVGRQEIAALLGRWRSLRFTRPDR